jgi:hypothetical protein
VKIFEADPIGWWTPSTLIVTLVFIKAGLLFLSVLALAKCFLIVAAFYNRPRHVPWISILQSWNWWANPSQPGSDNWNAEAESLRRNLKEYSIFRTRGYFLSFSSLSLSELQLSHPRVEPRTLGVIRGVLAVVFCLFIFGRGFADLVIGGIHEAGVTTVRWVFVQSLEPLGISNIPAPVWSVLVVRLLSHLYGPF